MLPSAAATAAAAPRTDEPRSAAESGASAETLLSVRGLRHVIGGRTVVELPEWSVTAGRHSLVLGPSGSGKTTLLHIVAAGAT